MYSPIQTKKLVQGTTAMANLAKVGTVAGTISEERVEVRAPKHQVHLLKQGIMGSC